MQGYSSHAANFTHIAGTACRQIPEAAPCWQQQLGQALSVLLQRNTADNMLGTMCLGCQVNNTMRSSSLASLPGVDSGPCHACVAHVAPANGCPGARLRTELQCWARDLPAYTIYTKSERQSSRCVGRWNAFWRPDAGGAGGLPRPGGDIPLACAYYALPHNTNQPNTHNADTSNLSNKIAFHTSGQCAGKVTEDRTGMWPMSMSPAATAGRSLLQAPRGPKSKTAIVTLIMMAFMALAQASHFR